jgi:hypothetical protein
MSDLAEQIRERLNELTKPGVVEISFPTDATAEQIAEFEALWEEARRGPHIVTMIPPSPIDRMRNALLTVVELHEGDGEGGAHECPAREHRGFFTEYEIDCTTLREIAEKLGIEVDHG